MKNRWAIIIGATLLASEGVWLFGRLQRKSSVPVQDFTSVRHDTELDLNRAQPEQLLELGLNSESVDRVIENRPYRNKMELLSRIIVTEDVYESIKDKISVHNPSEPVKVA
jgi:hypothetical protein